MSTATGRASVVLCATVWALLCLSLPPESRAESYTTNIINGVSTNAAGPYTLGGSGPFNVVIVTTNYLDTGAVTNWSGRSYRVRVAP